jgi:hypothetical protein
MKFLVVVSTLVIFLQETATAQSRREDVYTDFVLYNKRMLLQKDLRGNIVDKTFSMPIDSNSEYRFESACNVVSQYMFADETVKQGFEKLFIHYDELQYDTKKAFLEAVYATYPTEYLDNIQQLLTKETQPKLFAIAAVYCFRAEPSVNNANNLKLRMAEQFPAYDTLDILLELEKYLSHKKNSSLSTAQISDLFKFQGALKQKVIYSFQRNNRDYPGLAIVQNANGSFIKNPDGHIMIFQQLARSGSNLPYFITNGNTPQGVYSIRGTAVANNKLIGPTPNLQMIIPWENKWENYFQLPAGIAWDTLQDPLKAYLQLLPPAWRSNSSMTEAYYAGKIGRNAIIAHGTTIDPEYFRNKPWYPLTPTQGCLCARELWNVTTGRLLVSEQFNMVSAFTATPGYKGFLYVIDVDDQQKPVSREEVEAWIKNFEAGN